MCVNQSRHRLRLARRWKIPTCNACAMWVLFQITFRPQQEIKAKLGDGRTIHSGLSSARLWYMHAFIEWVTTGIINLNVCNLQWKQEYIRRRKESVILSIAMCKYSLKSTEVKLTISTSISRTVMVTASRCVTTVPPLQCWATWGGCSSCYQARHLL